METFERKAAFEAAIAHLPIPTVFIWSDGSASDGVYNCGAGVLIETADTTERLAIPAGKFGSSYAAEMTAIKSALDHLMTKIAIDPGPYIIRIHTDSQSSLISLASGPAAQDNNCGINIWKRLEEAVATHKDSRVELVWVPGHVEVAGNEEADKLANKGRELPQEDVAITLPSAIKQLRRYSWEKWESETRRSTSQSLKWNIRCSGNSLPMIPDSDRSTARIIHQLRADRCPLLSGYLAKIGQRPSPLCPECQEEDEDAPHILTRCPRWNRQRLEIFHTTDPDPVEVFKDTKQLILFLRRTGHIRSPLYS